MTVSFKSGWHVVHTCFLLLGFCSVWFQVLLLWMGSKCVQPPGWVRRKWFRPNRLLENADLGIWCMTFDYFLCGALSWLYCSDILVMEFWVCVVFGSYFVVYQEPSWFCFSSPVGLHHEFPLTAIAPVARDHHVQYLCCVLCSSWAPSMEPLWVIIYESKGIKKWVCVPPDQLLLTHWLMSSLFLGIRE